MVQICLDISTINQSRIEGKLFMVLENKKNYGVFPVTKKTLKT